MSAPAPILDPDDLKSQLENLVIGQPEAIEAIVPIVEMFRARLNPEGRPAGAVLLLGPTGTGKTFLPECLSEVLHGTKRMLRIDCAEFQNAHEISKLLGAPPGYLGHRETKAILNQATINQQASDFSSLSIVVFDEIEKAHPALYQLLLGVLDKGKLTLGDNTYTDFENTLIFFTSNLGSREIQNSLNPNFGFARSNPASQVVLDKLNSIGTAASKKFFSAEFINRLSAITVYKCLQREHFEVILNRIIDRFTQLIFKRHPLRIFVTTVTTAAKNELINRGVSEEYGARELQRVVQKCVITPISGLILRGKIAPGDTVRVDFDKDFIIDVRSPENGEVQ